MRPSRTSTLLIMRSFDQISVERQVWERAHALSVVSLVTDEKKADAFSKRIAMLG